MKVLKFIGVVLFNILILPLLLIFNLLMMKKRKKTYLGIFYGSNRQLNDAFLRISDGGYIRYIVTDETLICRFKSNLKPREMEVIFKETITDIPFFVFPINNKYWVHNLPFEAENNLLTDNPIIEPKSKQPNNLPANYIINILNEIKSKQENVGNKIRSVKGWVNETTDLSDNITPDGYIEINGYKVKTEELIVILTEQMDQAVIDEDYILAGNIKNKLTELNKKTQ